MSEQQTTAERIRNLIFDAIQDSNYGEESTVAAPLGVTIAAEIDALTRERDEARAKVERYDSVISNAIAVLTIRARDAAKETP